MRRANWPGGDAGGQFLQARDVPGAGSMTSSTRSAAGRAKAPGWRRDASAPSGERYRRIPPAAMRAMRSSLEAAAGNGALDQAVVAQGHPGAGGRGPNPRCGRR